MLKISVRDMKIIDQKWKEKTKIERHKGVAQAIVKVWES